MVHEIVLVGGSTRIPYVQKMLSDFFGGKALNKGMNPDEAIANGAAIQAAILSGKGSDDMEMMLLLDVCPLTLGIKTTDPLASSGMMIPRNTTIPYEKKKEYFTPTANCKELLIEVFEGEEKYTTDNTSLGKFYLRDITPGPSGQPIDVTFTINADGILYVTAVERANGNKACTVIKERTGV